MNKLFCFIVLLVTLLTGCKTGINPADMSKLQMGMSRDEVIRTLGMPQSTEPRQTEETLWYIEDRGGRIPKYHYVHLRDGKFDAYGHGRNAPDAIVNIKSNSSPK